MLTQQCLELLKTVMSRASDGWGQKREKIVEGDLLRKIALCWKIGQSSTKWTKRVYWNRVSHSRWHQICTYPKLILNPIVMLSFSDEFAISSNRLPYLRLTTDLQQLLIQSQNSEFFSGTNVIVWRGLWICAPIIF